MNETDDPDLRVPKPAVDAQLNATLEDITDHQETRLEYINHITEKLKTCYDPEISTDIYTLGLIYDVKVTEARYVFVLIGSKPLFVLIVYQLLFILNLF